VAADYSAGSPVVERTLTRRELRAMQAREAAGATPPELQRPVEAPPEVVDTILHSGPIELPLLAPAPAPSPTLENAMAEFDALTRGSQLTDASAPVRSPLDFAPEQEAPQWITEHVARQPENTQDQVAPTALLPLAEPVVTEPQALERSEVAEAPRAPWAPPPGHWSTQGDLDDVSQPNENTINRTIGSGSSTTNALVLPVIPLPSDMTNALTSTGEIMLTGSIDLPRSLGSTGASSRIDDDGIDALFDSNDHEIISTDSQPVRAIRAISTHNNNGHSVTHTQKPKGNRMLTALIISAVAMAVVAIGLLVTAMTFNVF
jgi:hypothetical protein